MKRLNARLVAATWVIPALAISFTVPTLAQQKETVNPQIDIADVFAALGQVSPSLDQKAWLVYLAKFDAAFNNNNATALTALFAKDAVLLTDSGPVYGREAIEKYWADAFKNEHFSNHILKPDQYSPHVIGAAGYEVWSNGEWSHTIQGKDWGPINQKGYWGSIDVLEDGVLKCRIVTWNVTPPPAATTASAETK